MNKKTVFYILFFAGLAVTFFLVLTRIIPGFGEVKMPVMSYVQPFSFTNQYGETITDRKVDGHVYVAEYFFTTCKGICPKMNDNMRQIYTLFRNEQNFLILSHTVDPDTDSVGRLRHYADSLGVEKGNWQFLTGPKDSLYSAARVSYLLDDPKNNSGSIEDQFIHTQFFALVDKAGRVRKIYDGLKSDEISELKKDIPRLLTERTEQKTFANSLFSNSPN